MSSRLQKIREKWTDARLKALPGVPEKLSPDSVFNLVISIDPTKQHKYTEWCLKAWERRSFLYEDIKGGYTSKVSETLHDFERFKRNIGDPRKDPDGDAKKRSLMSYTGIGALYRSVEKWVLMEKAGLTNISSNAEKRISHTKAKLESYEIITDSGLKVEIPFTLFASCELGRNTKWCTSAEQNNMFNDYAKNGPLLIFTLPTGERFQGHIDREYIAEIHKNVGLANKDENYDAFPFNRAISLMDATDTVVRESEDRKVFAPYAAEIIEILANSSGPRYNKWSLKNKEKFKELIQQILVDERKTEPRKEEVYVPANRYGNSNKETVSSDVSDKVETDLQKSHADIVEAIAQKTIEILNHEGIMDGNRFNFSYENDKNIDVSIYAGKAIGDSKIQEQIGVYSERLKNHKSTSFTAMDNSRFYFVNLATDKLYNYIELPLESIKQILKGEIDFPKCLYNMHTNIRNIATHRTTDFIDAYIQLVKEGVPLDGNSVNEYFHIVATSRYLKKEDVLKMREVPGIEASLEMEANIFSKSFDVSSTAKSCCEGINEIISHLGKEMKPTQRILFIASKVIPKLMSEIKEQVPNGERLYPEILTNIDFRPLIEDIKHEISPEKTLYSINCILPYYMDELCVDTDNDNSDYDDDGNWVEDKRYLLTLTNELSTNIQNTLKAYGLPSSIDDIYMSQETETDMELKSLMLTFLIEAAAYSPDVGPGHKLYHLSQSIPGAHGLETIRFKSREGGIYSGAMMNMTLDTIQNLKGNTLTYHDIKELKIRSLLSMLVITPDENIVEVIRSAPLPQAISSACDYEGKLQDIDVELLKAMRNMPGNGQFSKIPLSYRTNFYHPHTMIANVVRSYALEAINPSVNANQISHKIGID